MSLAARDRDIGRSSAPVAAGVSPRTSLELRTPPHNLTMEQAVLAALLTVNESWPEVSERLHCGHFYSPRHQVIWETVEALAAANEPYDTLMVFGRLQTDGRLDAAGGEAYLGTLMESTPPSLVNLPAYADRLRDLATRRELAQLHREAVDLAYEPAGCEVSELLDKAERALYATSERYRLRTSDDGPKDMPTVLRQVIRQVEERQHSDSPLLGLSTGFVELDNKTAGLQAGNLIIVAARPSMGKTTFAMNLVESIVLSEDLPVVVFSLEMPSDSILLRLVSSFGGIDQGRLRSGQLQESDWQRLTTTVSRLQNRALFIDDSAGLSPNEVRSRARKIARQHGGKLGAVMVDYLQLMQVPGVESRVAEISEISRSLKALAKELNCPVIALSQLNRSLEQRPNKRPIMSDLRESGAIEQDADVILFIYRDEVYTKESCKEPGIAEIIIGKQRNGPVGTVRLGFQGQFTRFCNLAPGAHTDYAESDQ